MARIKKSKSPKKAGEEHLLDIRQYSLESIREETDHSDKLTTAEDGHDVSVRAAGVSKATPVTDAKTREMSTKARGFIDKLIEEDVARIRTAAHEFRERAMERQMKKTKQPGQKNVFGRKKSTIAPSSYVLDLRRQYLIQKNKLDVLDRPARSFIDTLLDTASAVQRKPAEQWHIPARLKRFRPTKPVRNADQN